ncbi:MAG: UDP-2,3-diacylglucosamine diphosphatase [Coxiellaceae bacterium]|nr:UDP-2,3-diacylglucosamine diphosphatase [Coxiellaceae bacterium]
MLLLQIMTNKNTTLFISDLHLDPANPEITEIFFYFLEHIAPDADALYILGDFFESYIGDDDNHPFIKSIKHALSKTAEKGLSIFLMHGNRDFLIGEKFALESGLTLIPDPYFITLYNQPVLLMHGDSLCNKDKYYQLFRKIIRSGAIKKIASLLPLYFKAQLANTLRKKSMQYNHTKSAEIMDVCAITVSKVMKKNNAVTLIHGHTHKPAIHDLPDHKKRIVLNAWHDGGYYLEVCSNGEMKLIDIPETR